MGLKRTTWAALAAGLVILLIQLTHAAPKRSHIRHHHKHSPIPEEIHEENARAKSYIDIDASDPFKVPKSSQYIDQPVPEFTKAEMKDKKDEEDNDNDKDGPPSKAIDNIQDDLKHLGLDNLGGSPSGGEDDKSKAVDSPDDGQNAAPPQVDTQQPPAAAPPDDSGNATADAGKPVEVDDMDKNGGAEPESRHNVAHESEDTQAASTYDEEQGNENKGQEEN